MYKVIGADKKEYGPVTAEVIQRWVTEGRANSQTLLQSEGSTEWKPLSEFPEFADALRATPAASSPVAPGQPPLVPTAALVERDYTLDIASCISRSWELVKAQFWPIVGISLLVTVATAVVNQLIGIFSGPATRAMILERRFSVGGVAVVLASWVLSAPLDAVFMGGLFRYYLKLIRGQRAELGDAFSGFNLAFGQLALLGLVKAILGWLGFLFCVLPWVYLSVAWIFSVPLVIDRRMQFWDAMELSRKVVSKHWFLLFAFVLVLGLIAACGFLACCVGLFVSIPIASVALMYAYEDVFGRQGG